MRQALYSALMVVSKPGFSARDVPRKHKVVGYGGFGPLLYYIRQNNGTAQAGLSSRLENDSNSSQPNK